MPNVGRIILATERLVLRELTSQDAANLSEVLTDPGAMRFYPAPFTDEQIEGWLRWITTSYERNGFGLWGVVRASDGRFLGDCGPMIQPVDGHAELEIGYHIVRAEWGKGYATEAARACRDDAFNRLGAERVVSIVDPANAQSRRVASKVHSHEREFVWEKSARTMCLYWTDRAELAPSRRRLGWLRPSADPPSDPPRAVGRAARVVASSAV